MQRVFFVFVPKYLHRKFSDFKNSEEPLRIRGKRANKLTTPPIVTYDKARLLT